MIALDPAKKLGYYELTAIKPCSHMTKFSPILLPPANEVCEGYVFTRVCQSFCSRGGVWLLGACVVAGGHVVVARGCAWLGGMCGCQGACIVAGGCAWLPGGGVWLLGGMHGLWGHVWLPGCMRGCQGACLVAGGGGCAWLPGGMRGCWEDMCGCEGGGCVGYDEI